MNILQEYSNVLIADPTGAGKTKLCVTLVLALKHWLWETGRYHKENSAIVCPKLVESKWRKEFVELSNTANDQVPMSLLSRSGKNSIYAEEKVSLANILVVDEAHNFLNTETNRSTALRINKAEFKILLTATPISRKIDGHTETSRNS